MWESSGLLGALTPKFYVALTGTSSLISGLILIFEWWYFRKYGTSFIEQVSLTHLGPWLGGGAGGGGGGGAGGVGPTGATSTAESDAGECRVWRNPYALLRGAEYSRLGRTPLTYYDMNLSAQDHQAWFGESQDEASAALSAAWRERAAGARAAAARLALTLRPDCAPALLLLAEEDAPTVVEAERLLRLALSAAECGGRRGGGSGCSGAVVVHARRRLAGCARRLGRLREAARAYRELARDPPPVLQQLAPHENLIEVLLEMRAYADLQGVLSRYEEAGTGSRSATLVYTTALVRARHAAALPAHTHARHQADLAAHEAMRAAVEYNAWVGEYLLELVPLCAPPEHVVRRGRSEALAYAFAHLPHWRRHEPALRLLARHHRAPPAPAPPCGGAAPAGCAACADRELLGPHANAGARRAPALLPAGAALCAGTAALALLAHRWPDALHPSAIHTLLSAL